MNKAQTSTGSSAFALGKSKSEPGNSSGAGGVNLKKPHSETHEETGGDALNRGRLNGGTERNYNGRGPVSIPRGSSTTR